MKIVILTTETLHHSYFVREIAARYSVENVIIESKSVKAPFETAHSFEQIREEHELAHWFCNTAKKAADFAQTFTVDCINCDKTVTLLKEITPDIILVFGTGKLSPQVISTCPNGMLNLHGGNPEEYRGLDSHLWAIYHNDYINLQTTLHRVNSELDDGDIVSSASIPIYKNMQLHELQQVNTEMCVSLVYQVLDYYQSSGDILSRPQCRQGRYYSFCPAVIKEICVKKFTKHSTEIS